MSQTNLTRKINGQAKQKFQFYKILHKLLTGIICTNSQRFVNCITNWRARITILVRVMVAYTESKKETLPLQFQINQLLILKTSREGLMVDFSLIYNKDLTKTK